MKFPGDFFEQGGLWFPKDSSGVIDYTDGDAVEARLETVLSQAQDLSTLSPELRDAIVDWPTRYHLSSERSNLLRCLELEPNANVLELGAGCGAITRYLAERVERVTALEGSPSRAQLCRLRCRGREQVRMIVGDFFKVELAEAFDLVTLIGVLEYAGVYGREASEPALELLQRAAASLRPGGQLLVAIENQFGLKYFSGCGEDHGDPRFSGIEGYPEGTGVRTFGRRALERLLRRAGLEPQFLVLPFPDYKVPNSFINARHCDPEDAERLGLADWCRKPFEDYARPRDYLFDDHLALRELALNGLLPDFANSFLMVATLGEPASPPVATPAWAARRFNTTRHEAFRTDTVLEHEAGAEPRVVKRRLESSLGPRVDAGTLCHVIEPEGYVAHAESMSLAMLQALRKSEGAEEAFAGLLAQWLGFFTAEHTVEGTTDQLRGEFLDCVPDNLLRTEDGSWQFIDREWRYGEPVLLDWLFYRGLVGFWAHHALAIAGVVSRELEGRERFVCRCFELLGSPVSPGTLARLEQRERALQELVRQGPGTSADDTPVLRASAPAAWGVPGRSAIVQGTGLRLIG